MKTKVHMKMLATCIAALIACGGANAANITKEGYVTKEEFGGMVRNYLLENPRVIIDAVEKIQKEEMAKEMSGTKEAIKANYKAIYDNPNHGTIGDKSAKVAIVEFFDYNCSACKFMFKPLDALRQAGLKDIRIIFVEYPIFGDESKALARIALAVNQLIPAKYYEFHGKMMEHKGKIDANVAYSYAESVGLKRADLQKELANEKYSKILADNAKIGEALKLRGTPFLIIGDEPVPSALDEAGLQEYINKAKTK